MKSIFFKYFFTGLLVLSLAACEENKSEVNKKIAADAGVNTSATNTTPPKLSSENQNLAKNCNQNNQEACKKLVENLVKECKNNNAQSCVDSAVIFIKLNDNAVKDNNNQLAAQSYNYAVSALIKACDLGKQGACNSLEELSSNIFNNLKNLKSQCETQNNADACKVVQQAKQALENSCKAGKKQDCEYLKDL